VVFVWWALLAAIVIFLPMFLYWFPSSISATGWWCILASGVLHALYFGFLGGAYQRGDLSLVYPLCRGSGPLFVPIFAMALINEQLAMLGAAGIVLVVSGIYVINLHSFSGRAFLQPILSLRGGAALWAMFTGVAIAAYSLVDKVGVAHVFPPVYIYLMLLINWVALSAYVLPRERAWIKREWAANKRTIILVGFLSNFTYLIILFAMQFAKVSYVVAVREVSIVFSAAIGVLWLGEQHARQKLIGAVIITCGVVLIGLSK
jgi:drug/metabolite transporter (DMT)-like permease